MHSWAILIVFFFFFLYSLSIHDSVFLTVVGYFAIGSVVMYFHRGARGREIIPHVNFWMSIPVLVKASIL